jgi:dipeptide/tripeptide permease
VAINFVYLLIPDGLNKIDIGGWSLGNMGFGSLDNLAWYLLKKISIVLFLIIWFISAKNWWKMAILTPLIIYSYQIIEVFFDIGDVDAGNNSKILPILFPVIIALLFLIQIVRLKSRLMDYIDQFEKELETEISNISKSE